MSPKKTVVSKMESPDSLMQASEHPFKPEIEELRIIIKNASSKIAERIKWNAPSYFYIKDMAAFNLHQEKFVQIIFIFYNGTMINDSGDLLEGKWKDRREARFYSMEDIKNKKTKLEKVVREWIDLIENN
ncbi:MAG: DUF1801 domain-containing protein [Chitinophagales bacterium]|jgi:hypothetical protein|nr:DUF1801 domain-containing protein [Chitinophagales bacterium]MBP9221259.1 DUF1801 domain-containing protein [Chitinophagales bacterium]MBP9795282.1 DUF1801 domain-containing protein [Chitinophagales bacterium]